MAELPQVSVALNVHNGARFLPAQLASVLAQEGVELEVIALDDHSTDDSLDILREWASRDPRIRVYRNDEHAGPLKSFEACMALCTAPLIAPCDQDDVWHPGKLARLVEAIGEADLAYCDSGWIDSAGQPAGHSVAQDIGPMIEGRDVLKLALHNTLAAHSMLLRREVFDAALPFPALMHPDWWLGMRAAAGRGVVYVDEALVQVRRIDMSASAGVDASGMKRKRSASRNKRWLAQGLYVFEQLLYVDWFPRSLAMEWHAALRAGESGRLWPLWGTIWRSRGSLPYEDTPPWLAAVRFWGKCADRVRRARKERAFEGPLFK